MNYESVYIIVYSFFYQPNILTNLFILNWDVCCKELYDTLIRHFPEYRQ
jgi:hypothetical protein